MGGCLRGMGLGVGVVMFLEDYGWWVGSLWRWVELGWEGARGGRWVCRQKHVQSVQHR